MSKSLNKFQLLGNVGSDPETSHSPNGTSISKLNLATNYAVKDAAGQWSERVDWHRVTFFGRNAELVAQYVRAGSRIFVEGRISQGSYTRVGETEKRFTTDLIGSQLVLLDGRGAEVYGIGSDENPSNGTV